MVIVTYMTSTNDTTATATDAFETNPEHGRNIIVHTFDEKEYRGWRHEANEWEGPEGFLYLMPRDRRKKAILIPRNEVRWWGYDWR